MNGHNAWVEDYTPPTTAGSNRPVDSANRPCSAPLKSLSPNTGDDELEMRAFTRQAMLSIVRPISEHIAEVEAQFQRLQKDILCKMVDLNQSIARFDNQDAQLLVLRRSIQKADTRIDGMYKELSSGVSKARSSTNEAVSVASAAEAQLKMLSTQVKELQDLHAAQDPEISILVQNEVPLLNMLNSYTDLEAEVETLGHSVLGLSQRLEQTKSHNDESVRNFKTLSADFMHEKDASEFALKRFQGKLDTVVSVELAKFRGDLAAQVKRSADHESKICSMRTALDTLDAGVMKNAELLEGQNKSIHKTLCQFDSRTAIDLLYKQVRDIYSNLEDLQIASEEDRPILTELGETVEKHATDSATMFAGLEEHIQRVETTQQSHNDDLQSIDAKLNTHENVQQALKERVHVSEGLIASNTAGQQSIGRTVEMHASELRSSSDRLGCNEVLHEERSKDVRNLRAGIEETGVAVRDALERLDLAHDYLQGVSKGFQDANQRINDGEDGFPRPHQHTVRHHALPKLPGSSRPQSGSSRPPSRGAGE